MVQGIKKKPAAGIITSATRQQYLWIIYEQTEKGAYFYMIVIRGLLKAVEVYNLSIIFMISN